MVHFIPSIAAALSGDGSPTSELLENLESVEERGVIVFATVKHDCDSVAKDFSHGAFFANIPVGVQGYHFYFAANFECFHFVGCCFCSSPFWLRCGEIAPIRGLKQ